jgi:uncharacterized protein (TIGR02246 family)
MKLFRPLALAALAVSLQAAAGHAQTLFGLIPNENPGNAPSAYVLRVKQEVTMMIGSYKRAWDGHNAQAAAALYTRDGRMLMEGQEAQSRPQIQARLAEMLPAAGQLHYSIMDFDTSGDMAFVSGQMSYAAGDQAGASMEYVLVARRTRGDEWFIRSLVLMPAAAAPAASPAAAQQGAGGG